MAMMVMLKTEEGVVSLELSLTVMVAVRVSGAALKRVRYSQPLFLRKW